VDRRRLSPLAAAVLAAVAGCGPTPPQAPGPEAHRLNTALSTFSTACGHAAEIQAFTHSGRAMTITEHQAQSKVPVVAAIYRRNPSWIFQGKTVAELVSMSERLLDECGLHQAADRLRSATSSQ
jgi:uncharacterized protein YjiS (DUF1127 family)